MQAQEAAQYRTELEAAFEKRGGVGDTVRVRVNPEALPDHARPTLILRERGLLLGDAIVRVPAYRAARAAFPQHRIVSLSSDKSVFANAFAPIAHLFFDEIFSGVEANSSRAQQRELSESFGKVDTVLDFRANPRSALNFFTYRGLASRYLANSPFFGVRFGMSRQLQCRPGDNAGRYHRMVEIAAGRRLPYDFSLPHLPSAATRAAALLPPTERYFGITSGPLTQSKSWPREGHIDVAARIRSHGYRPVVLLGAFEGEQREWYETNIPDAVIVDLSTAEGDSGYLLWLLHAAAGRLAGCVSNENGLQHLVATQGIPLLTIAGPTNVDRWKPVTPLWWCIRAQQFGSDQPRVIPASAVADMVSQMIRWIERNDENRADAALNKPGSK